MSFDPLSDALPFPFTPDLVRARQRRRTDQSTEQDILDAQEESKRKQQEKEQRVLSQLKEVPPPLIRSKVSRQQFEARENLRRSIQSNNTRLLASIGVKPKSAGTLQRTAVDILEGKSNVPLSQVPASVQRQVELERLNRSLSSGKVKLTTTQLAALRGEIEQSASEKAASEAEFRRQRSVNKARGEAAKFEESRLIALDESQRQNKFSQIRATGLQNQKVFDTLTSLGFSTDLTRATPRKVARPDPVSDPSQREFALQQVNRPIDESTRVLTSGQINSGDKIIPLDSQEFNPRKSILNDFFTAKSEIPVSQNLLVENRQGPTNKFIGFVPSISKNTLGFEVTGEFGEEQSQSVKQSFTGTKQQFFKERVISKVAKDISDFGDSVNDPLGKFAAGVAEETIGIGTSLVNLGAEGFRLLGSAISGKERPQEPGLFVAPTVTGEFISGPVEGAGKALQTGDPKDFFAGFAEGGKRADELRKKQGDIRSIGQFVAFAAPNAPGVKKLNPVRVNPIILPLKTGEQKVATTITAFGKPIATRQGGKTQTGGPRVSEFPLEEISPSGRGFEIGTGTSKIAQKVKEELIDVLGSRGIISPIEVAKVKTVREIVELGSQAKKKTFRKDFGGNPFKELSPGKQTEAQLEFFRKEKLPPITGSFSQIPQILPEFARRAGDFDIHIGSIERGAQLARRNVKALQPTASPLEQFIAVEAKVKKIKGKEETKIGEFLTKADELIGDGQGLTLDSVFGIKEPIKGIKVSGIKVTTLKSQLLRKASTVSALQGPESAGVVKGGLGVGPPGFRTKDITDLFAIGKTQAFVLRESGKTAKAKQLDIASERLKELFPKVDFDTPFAKGERVQFGIKEPGLLESVISKTPKKGVPSLAPRLQNESSISSSMQVKEPTSIFSITRSSVSKRSNTSSIPKPPRISISNSLGKSSREKSITSSSFISSIPSVVSSKSGTSKSATSRSRPSVRSSFTGFGDPTLLREPRIKIGLLDLKLKLKAKKEEEAVVGIGQKQFRTGTADPLAPGVIASFGVKERISKSSKIFKQLDKSLVRSRKKRSKFGVFDIDKPFGEPLKF